MPQGTFNFKYIQNSNSSGMTAYGGLGLYFDLFSRLDLVDLVKQHLTVSGDNQGWSDWQQLLSVLLLNFTGGDCVDDINILNDDEGLCRLLRRFEQTLGKKERLSLKHRFRKGRTRAFPGSSSLLRYLKRFHDESMSSSDSGGAFIPTLSKGLEGLVSLNSELLSFKQLNRESEIATLDLDATVVPADKQEAQRCYQGYKSYQPLNVLWHEQNMIAHSEFRDGNVPAGHDLTRVLSESLLHLPKGIKKIYVRSDSAGYKYDLLDYCELGKNEHYGRIEFCINSVCSREFKGFVSSLSESEWKPLHVQVGSKLIASRQEWAEVDYVPGRKGFAVDAPIYRYLAVREEIRQPVLEALDSDEAYDFPTAVCEGKRYKIHGFVTNMDWDAEELIRWSRKRCGRGEQIHSVMKSDFAGGKLPCGEFGANAAWWQMMILALNLQSIMQELVLDESWKCRRMKAIRFGIINIAARVIYRSRQLQIVLSKYASILDSLIKWRKNILQLIPLPPL